MKRLRRCVGWQGSWGSVTWFHSKGRYPTNGWSTTTTRPISVWVPSFYESFGLVAAEAIACGTPVVATAVGGLPETVKDGLNGSLIRDRNPEALAEKISLLLNDVRLRGLLASQARESVAALDWPTVAGRVAGLYESVYRAVN